MINVAIFGGSKLGQGPWRPGRKIWSIAIFGGSDIDFRQADLEEGVTKLVAFSLFGGHKVFVPPDMPVTLSGLSIFGGKDVEASAGKGRASGLS